MKLWYSPASPYVRKVLILAHEAGLIDQIEIVTASQTPLDPNDGLAKDNPLGKIPTLVRDDGLSIFDSPVICEYLDGLHEGDKMFPEDKELRINALITQAIADGMCDAAVGNRHEMGLRPQEYIWQDWLDAQFIKVTQSLDVLESWRGARLQDIHIGSISVAAALGYISFRFPEIDWRENRPVLTQMYETFSKRQSMIASDPNG